MATTDFVRDVFSNQSSGQLSGQLSRQSLTRWGQVLHDAGSDDEAQMTVQLWKQHHKQGIFGGSTRFGFTGMLSRLHNQRRTNR